MLPPIAMIHHVSNDTDYGSLQNWCISHKTFLQFINYLSRHHYQTITLRDIAVNKSLLASSSKKVIITFDDCPKNLFDFAIPELVKRKMKAAFYIPTAHIGQYNWWDVTEGGKKIELMNEEDLKELSNLGMEVAPHAHHHIKLKQVPCRQLEDELTTCKAIVEAIIQQPVYSFSYPYASVPKQYQRMLRTAGYQYALSIYTPFENKFALRRFGCY